MYVIGNKRRGDTIIEEIHRISWRRRASNDEVLKRIHEKNVENSHKKYRCLTPFRYFRLTTVMLEIKVHEKRIRSSVCKKWSESLIVILPEIL